VAAFIVSARLAFAGKVTVPVSGERLKSGPKVAKHDIQQKDQ
jgi:hypothetical protein